MFIVKKKDLRNWEFPIYFEEVRKDETGNSILVPFFWEDFLLAPPIPLLLPLIFLILEYYNFY